MSGDAPKGLRIVGASGAPRMGKKQQRFHKLVKDVARLKEAVRAWTHALPEIHRGIAEHERLVAEHRGVIRELVRGFDRSYSHPSLTKRERACLRRILCETAYEALQDGDDAELKEIYNRHSQSDFDAEAAAEDAAQTDAVRYLLEEQLGLDLGLADVRSLDELEAAMAAKMKELDLEAERARQAAAERKARRKKSAREVAAESRRDAERAQVSKALQEVYRKLAIALHPDREPDPEERARKTLLMQQINVAYEARDLLQLLELQLRFEQIDEAEISTLAEDRLERYNHLLGDQVFQLRQELAEIELPWRVQLDVPLGKLTAAMVQARLQTDLRQASNEIAGVRGDLRRLADPGALKAWLQKALAAQQRARRARSDPFDRLDP